MKKRIKFYLLVITIVISSKVSAGQYDLPPDLYNSDISSSDLNTIQDLFPERGGINPAFVSSSTDPNLYFTSTGDLSVTYVDEGAGYLNKFGYFTFDENSNVVSSNTLFENASGLYKGGSLTAGDTLDIGTFEEGDKVGFWLQANGYYNPNGNTYYTIDELNPDGLRHIAIVEMDEEVYIGIEDLYNLGDEDYNDIIFKLSVSPIEALNTERIPGNPAPPVVITAILSLFTFLGVFIKSKIHA